MPSVKSPARLILPFLMLLSLVHPALSRAESPEFSIGLGFDYSTGDYGTDETSDFWAVPLVIDYYPHPRFDLEAVIPYVFQSSGATVLSGGQRFAVDRPRRGQQGGGMVQPVVTDVETSEKGLGDISLTGGYLLASEGVHTPSARAFLYLKLPTASENRGLGTGTFDLGPGLEIAKWFDRWYTRGNASYVFQGENEDFELKDYLRFGAEVGNQVSSQFFISVSLWGATPPSEQSPTLLDAQVKGIFWASEKWRWEGNLSRGLSDGSPDFGGGLAVYRRF